MNSTEFLFWLQGYFELEKNDSHIINNMQIDIIKEHIKLVEQEQAFTSTFMSGLKMAIELYEELYEEVDDEVLFPSIGRVIKSNLKKQFEKLTPTKDRPFPFDPSLLLTPSLLVPRAEVWSSPGGSVDVNNLSPNSPPGSC